MRSTHNISHGLHSTSLIGTCPYFSVCFLHFWHVGHFLIVSATCCCSLFNVKCWFIVISVLFSPGWHSCTWYQSITFWVSTSGITILPSRTIKSLHFPPQSRVFPVQHLAAVYAGFLCIGPGIHWLVGPLGHLHNICSMWFLPLILGSLLVIYQAYLRHRLLYFVRLLWKLIRDWILQ